MFQLSSGDIKKERMFLTGGQGVAGSNPVIPTNFLRKTGYSQAGTSSVGASVCKPFPSFCRSSGPRTVPPPFVLLHHLMETFPSGGQVAGRGRQVCVS